MCSYTVPKSSTPAEPQESKVKGWIGFVLMRLPLVPVLAAALLMKHYGEKLEGSLERYAVWLERRGF